MIENRKITNRQNDIKASKWNDVCRERTSAQESRTTIIELLIKVKKCLTKSLMISIIKQAVNLIILFLQEQNYSDWKKNGNLSNNIVVEKQS
jgi:hypothetical protein